MIKFKNVGYDYEKLKLQFNFHFLAGQKVAILGPSGAGKSSLLNLIAGFLLPQTGQIYLQQQPMSTLIPSKRPVSILFQTHNLFTHLTVAQNIALGLHPGLKLSATQQQELFAIISTIGLADYVNFLPEALSGGQQQRVALARCLLRNQPILLLDEPFIGLDDNLRYQMYQLIQQAWEKYQFTLVMVTHTLSDARALADHIVLIKVGAIEYAGNIENIA